MFAAAQSPQIKSIPRVSIAPSAPAPVVPIERTQSQAAEATRAAPRARSSTQSLEEKLLSYLSRNCSNEEAAAACGISVSRVSQLITEPEFASRLAEARFANAAQYQERDQSWDSLEDKLLERAHAMVGTLTKPSEIVAMARMANSATRRASSSPDSAGKQTTVVNLILPQAAMARFITNAQNQVVQTGSQSLVTIQSGVLAKQAAALVEGEANERLLTEKTYEGQSSREGNT